MKFSSPSSRRAAARPPLFRLAPLCLGAASSACAAGLLLEPRLSLASDVQAGGRAGIAGLPFGVGSAEVYLDFDARLFPHKVRVPVSPTFAYQYRETRWGVGAGASHVFPLGAGGALNEWSVVMGGGLAYSRGDYRGSARAAESGWVGWGEAGIRYTGWDEYIWGAAVQVKPLPDVFPARLLLQLGWAF